MIQVPLNAQTTDGVGPKRQNHTWIYLAKKWWCCNVCLNDGESGMRAPPPLWQTASWTPYMVHVGAARTEPASAHLHSRIVGLMLHQRRLFSICNHCLVCFYSFFECCNIVISQLGINKVWFNLNTWFIPREILYFKPLPPLLKIVHWYGAKRNK